MVLMRIQFWMSQLNLNRRLALQRFDPLLQSASIFASRNLSRTHSVWLCIFIRDI